MSEQLLCQRLDADLDVAIAMQLAVIVEKNWEDLPSMARQQGILLGLKQAKEALEYRYKNLHAMG